MKKQMIPQEILITPLLAAQWLQFNTGNRNLPVNNSKYYAELIRKGEFLTTHQALAFTGDIESPGRLLDGQTRLTAVIATGKPIKQWVFWNAPEVTFAAIDGGKPRSFVDHNPDYDKQSISVVNVFWWLSQPSVKRITRTDADKIWNAFGQQYQQLIDCCPTARKGLTCAAVRAAFCLCMYQNQSQAVEIANIYRNLALEKAENLPVAATRLCFKLLTIVGAGLEAVRVQFPFTHKAITPCNWSLTKLYGPESDYFQTLTKTIKSAANL
ncbi:MAG: hypothetical protein O2960_26045 [Verrucomicrobia bacterium]|nr:hypothetical protein [Verrucomicrobiota bacterium]